MRNQLKALWITQHQYDAAFENLKRFTTLLDVAQVAVQPLLQPLNTLASELPAAKPLKLRFGREHTHAPWRLETPVVIVDEWLAREMQ
ncbi:hypothetical protein DYU11_10580 [Fibrisoma montanum]|uniref:Uncharacterized protein n=1 Tax=Fibrisoma montanum TaxID=2305895 RepID=A0A418MAQ7_9BACT|nr:hypothetical protein [Fibrisoma montanum]RIV23439.1 hypothetical protein DYU11_10580 [Fibrisoma montanum]